VPPQVNSRFSGRTADEGMDADFLVGPMELGPESQMVIVLELAE
jgi:hypothetical protein